MRRTRIRTLWGLGLVGAGFAAIFGALTLAGGRAPIALPAPLSLLIAVVGGVILMWGWRVRESARRDEGVPKRRTDISPLQSARVAILAQACSRCGACFAGFFPVLGALFWRTGHTHYVHAQVTVALLSGAASLFLCVCGVIAERWCIVSIDDDGPAPGAAAA